MNATYENANKERPQKFMITFLRLFFPFKSDLIKTLYECLHFKTFTSVIMGTYFNIRSVH